MSIRNLPTVSSVASADLIPLASASLGSDAVVTPATLAAYLQALLTASNGGFESKYNTPLTGFSYQVTPTTTGESVYLLLTPAGTLATGTVTLPVSPVHGQEVLVASTQTVTALTVSGGSYTAVGAPTTMGATSPWRMRYDGVLQTWNRVV